MIKDGEITLKYFRRYPDSKRTRSFYGKRVHISTDKGFWRHHGRGYTYPHQKDAGVWDFEDALTFIEHLGTDKQAKLVLERSYFTDYPIFEIGDKYGEKAPIRRIQPIWYDGNKYVEFEIYGTDIRSSCKSGYIYSKEKRFDGKDIADTTIFRTPKWLY